MSIVSIKKLSRREFLKAGLGAAGGLTLALQLPAVGAALGGRLRARPGLGRAVVDADAATFEPNAFVRIGSDDRVTVVVKHVEMGQGTYTGLPTLLAEELDARWAQIRVVGAPVDAARYNNLAWGPFQGTGGSTAIANSFMQMRKAGAAARRMLVMAAADRWGVDEEAIQVQAGVVSHASGQRASFGDLAVEAAEQFVPDEVRLKRPSEFRLIGSASLRRKDSGDKVNGSALFTQDVALPGMLTALVIHPPRFGATLRSFQPADALLVPGVEQVRQIGDAVAVLATDFWSAKLGRETLDETLDWDLSKAFQQSSAELLQQYRALAQTPGAVATRIGDAEALLAAAGEGERVEAEYSVPFLAHAAMETMNCVIVPDGEGVQVYNGEQFQSGDQAAIAAVLGLRPEQVRIKQLYAGGSFGRRANPRSDYPLEAARIFKAAGGNTAVKLQWTREDDMRAGWYRPLFLHRLRACLDAQGRLAAWQHRIVGQSIAAGTAFEGAMVVDGIDQSSVEGAARLPYSLSNQLTELHSPVLPVPVQWWRSVGSTHTAFAVESAIDELAHKAGRDPVEFRLQSMQDHPRHQAVLRLVADKAGWGRRLPDGRGLGVALHESFNTVVGQVAEVSIDGSGGFRVERVVIAVDCGLAINPDVIRAQMEGGMAFGLSAALLSELSFADGAAQQSNFHDYQVLRIDQMPAVEVHIVASADAPSGVGEPATPVIAPAVANALFAATGQRLRRLPLKLA